jgi:hypothetical protein
MISFPETASRSAFFVLYSMGTIDGVAGAGRESDKEMMERKKNHAIMGAGGIRSRGQHFFLD